MLPPSDALNLARQYHRAGTLPQAAYTVGGTTAKYTSSLTPQLTATVTDPDGGNVRAVFDIFEGSTSIAGGLMGAMVAQVVAVVPGAGVYSATRGATTQCVLHASGADGPSVPRQRLRAFAIIRAVAIHAAM